ncbi:hypothetical protein NL676_032354 [Syzygium grande]|nr:hypothetical protein NL676_032354 [Syzygium grande]
MSLDLPRPTTLSLSPTLDHSDKGSTVTREESGCAMLDGDEGVVAHVDGTSEQRKGVRVEMEMTREGMREKGDKRVDSATIGHVRVGVAGGSVVLAKRVSGAL